MKVLVGICCGGTIHAQTATSLLGAVDQLKARGIDYMVSIQIGGDKAQGMNRLAREAVKGKYDFLMSIDNDMVFPADGIVKLIDHDKDIVGANYSVRGNAVRGNPREVVVKMADKNGKRITMPFTDLPDQLFRCNALGNGFTLYKTAVFEGMQAPWFYVKEDEQGNWSGEDVLMHEAAQAQGFEVWCSPTIHMGHIGTYRYENV